MTESNALERVVDVAVDVLSPLSGATRDHRTLVALLNQMGWSAPGIDLEELATAVQALTAAVEALRDEISFESLESLVATVGALAAGADALFDFAEQFSAAAGAADPQAIADVVETLSVDLLQHLSLLYLGRWPVVYEILSLLGLIDDRPLEVVTTGGDLPLLARAPVLQPRLAFEALGDLLADPVAHLRTRLGAQRLVDQATAEQVTRDVFDPLLRLVTMAGGSGVVGTGAVEPVAPTADDIEARRRATLLLSLPSFPAGGEPVTSLLALVVDLVHQGGTSRTGDAGPGFLLSPEGSLSATAELPGSRFEFALSGGAFSAFFPATGPPVVHGPAGGVTLELTYRKLPPQAGAPAISFGADTAKLTVEGLTATIRGRFGRSDAPELHLEIEGAVEKARFVLAPGEGDGFLAAVLPPDGIRFEFDLGLGWSNRRGVYFSGAASLEADFPLHVSLLGLLTIDVVSLALSAGPDGLLLDAGATLTLTLGPLTATVERLGLTARTTFPEAGGNLGPLDVVPGFLPPRGVGLVIDAGPVTGGGFVRNDPARGRYAGILELDIAGVVRVTAIGLIDTRMPDGSEGFSLVVILTAEFPPIQLGFGFTLSGLGGVLGLNRTMNLPALRDGARTGVLDSILFPVDPVARADKVISDVQSVFPVAPGRFTVGLMARIGWGSPQIVVVDLGIIVELPAPVRIVLLGRLGVVLPTPEAAVVELHLDVVGILDLGRGELSIDATLHDSRIAVFEVYGDMAIRIGWGATPAFAISVGGFNPRFTPPPDFPALRRMTIALAAGDNPRIRLESYLATTANSIQTGARLDAHAELDAGLLGLFSADAYLGFDALIVLHPFRFIVDLGGGIVIKRNGTPFIGAQLLLTLYGPQPLRASGYAEIEFFGKHRIPIDITLGEDPVEAALAVLDPLGALLRALLEPEAWTALPPDRDPLVSIADQPPAAVPPGAATPPPVLAHPRGRLATRQRVLPLGLAIERFGGTELAGGPRSYTATYRMGGVPVTGTPVRDSWAPGDLFRLTDDEKLSRPAFEQLVSGSDGLGTPMPSHGTAVPGASAVYETSIIDATDPVPRTAVTHTVPARIGVILRAGSAAAAAQRASGYQAPAAPVTVNPAAYVVASTTTLQASDGVHGSWVEAHAAAGTPGVQVLEQHQAVPA
ncbi:MAG: hypothetical protein IPG94_23095 [Kineosporiaceae bacterium]|nr:hypothetical protein [Kineosporiaceae bacterium]